jgi:tRNA threonylcarbamoyladenosine biosynthesis protein TsaB
MVDELLAAAGLRAAALDAIAFGAGPGSFTGVRIAAAVTQGIALAHDLPVARISTLAALAQGAWREHGARRLFPAIDARKQQIYWAHYQIIDDDATVTCINPDTLGPADSLAIPTAGTWAGIGSAWTVYRDRLTALAGPLVEPIGSILYPHAADIAALGCGAVESGELVDADLALPIYLRPGVD